MASVAEVKAAIDAAMQHVREGNDAAVAAARAALARATNEPDDCLAATLGAMERAEQYAAAL